MKLVKNVGEPGDEPSDRLGRLGKAMIEALEAHPDYRETDRALALVEDAIGATAAASGYHDPRDAVISLLAHAQAIASTFGTDLDVVTIPDAPPADEPTADA